MSSIKLGPKQTLKLQNRPSFALTKEKKGFKGKRRGLTVTISDYGAGGPRFKSRRRRFNLFSEFKLFGRYHHIELAQREASAKATTQTDGGKSSL